MSPSTSIASCSLCGKKEKTDFICPEGHYICEECRLDSPERLIKRVCISSVESNPLKIALPLLRHPAITMHGPEHHYLVACVLLATLKNSGKFNIGENSFDEALGRIRKIPYGSCGLLGACGAAVGVGVAISIATKANWMSNKERSLSMRSVSEVSKKISEIGGPRCCKASTFVSLELAARFLESNLGVKISPTENLGPCEFAGNNEDCLKNRCPYYGR